MHSGLHQKRGGLQAEGSACPHLLCPSEVLFGVLHPVLGSPKQEKCGTVEAGLEKSH